MQGDVVHFASPDQQGIRGIGGALVAVAAAFHHQPQVIIAGEIDGSDNVLGASGNDRVSARCRSPALEPAGGLRATRLFANEIGIFHLLDPRRAGRAAGGVGAWSERGRHRDEITPDLLFQLFPASRGGP